MTDEHCKDCCCARSWKALGITEYTGRAIPEHIESLRARLTEAENLLRECQEELDFEHTNCELLDAGISIFLDGASVPTTAEGTEK